jgi:hypothetical protein
LLDAAEWRPAHTRLRVALLVVTSEDRIIFFREIVQVCVEIDETLIRQQIDRPLRLAIRNGDCNVKRRNLVSYRSLGAWTGNVFNSAPGSVGNQWNSWNA